MEDLEKFVDLQLGRTKDLKDFCNIVCDENEKDALLLMNGELKELSGMISKCNSILKANPERMKEAKRVLREMRRQEIIMKLVLEKMDTGGRQETPSANLVSGRSSGLSRIVFAKSS